ncbi:poly(R)-hydroxyalkanoic acid synthase subunit PhaE [Halalkalicoccus sp. NIPERK01]|uniref:poly(R)-hydroxyalkanoic acid synthase subunit PhaE n=1 Tax=Halalkalicoccus sp. NIPERK01 TaxID=3053469 RepID=UPI00256F3525|nr:poly(R)-hydroxyalkanoic acid synthase subunit PhaE [Halalkalicoccus sp. NIPERK01]MDL5360783.1 poly(R)-hydroxyalkanoic acid synthase subunit PhaE [Halalkalicoccus sp. NIPERK01]
MTEMNPPMADAEQWNEFMQSMNDQFARSLEQNVEAQASFVESWVEAVEESTDPERFEEGAEGYANAYATWMDASQRAYERSMDMVSGEDVQPEEFRDIWLNAANEAFKDVTDTTAFAAATGKTVEEALDYRQEIDEMADETLHNLGFATKNDVQEVGERLIELERRQHAVENKLDTVIEHLEGEDEE